jgi:hypothetical protein
MKEPQTMTEFQYSRIYAQGWNAARTGSTAKTKTRNPYPADPERARWQQGFTAASGHKEGQA